MTLIQYNILDGAGERLPSIVEQVEHLAPELCTLCELNNWPEDFNPFPSYRSLLINHGSPSGYKVGLLSQVVPQEYRCLNNGLTHGAIVASFGTFNIVVIHLHPHDEEIRLREIEVILNEVHPSQPLVLSGDLNSLNPSDTLNEQRNRVLSLLLDAGFTDPHAGQQDNYTLRTGLKPSEPAWKLDFILTRGWQGADKGCVIHDEKFRFLSDHWPVLLEVATCQN